MVKNHRALHTYLPSSPLSAPRLSEVISDQSPQAARLLGLEAFPGLSPESSVHCLLSHHLLPFPISWNTFPGQISTTLSCSWNCCLSWLPVTETRLSSDATAAPADLLCTQQPNWGRGLPCSCSQPSKNIHRCHWTFFISIPSYQHAITFLIGKKNVLLIPTLLVSAPLPFFA